MYYQLNLFMNINPIFKLLISFWNGLNQFLKLLIIATGIWKVIIKITAEN